MKKGLIFLLLLIPLFTACEDVEEPIEEVPGEDIPADGIDYFEFDNHTIKGFQVYYVDLGACNQEVRHVFFEDEFTEFYYIYSGCKDDEYYYLHIGEDYVSIDDAIRTSVINLEDVMAFGEASNHEKPIELSSSCAIQYPIDYNLVAIINDYQIMRAGSITCTGSTGSRLIYNGYNFGLSPQGCGSALAPLLYIPYKDGQRFELETLIHNNEITTEQVYDVFMCDRYRRAGLMDLVSLIQEDVDDINAEFLQMYQARATQDMSNTDLCDMIQGVHMSLEDCTRLLDYEKFINQTPEITVNMDWETNIIGNYSWMFSVSEESSIEFMVFNLAYSDGEWYLTHSMTSRVET